MAEITNLMGVSDHKGDVDERLSVVPHLNRAVLAAARHQQPVPAVLAASGGRPQSHATLALHQRFGLLSAALKEP